MPDEASSPPSTPAPVPFAEALRFWARLGFISFGGPAGQIAIMHREIVERRRWISEERFLHALNFCMILPGPEAQQLATYIGWLLHGTRGGVIAGVLFVLPSVFVLLALSWVYSAFGSIGPVAAVLAGIQPVVVAIVLEALERIGRRALKRRAHYAIAAIAFAAIYFAHVPFPLIVVGSALFGIALHAIRPASAPPASDTRRDPPASAEASGRVRRLLIAFLLLWAIPYGALVAWQGVDGVSAQAYRFFTQAAFVTFGGAYAVLAYVIQVAVNGYGWLTQAQAMVGLALAETTPGPLIMVLQFIGFLAGWNHPGGATPLAAGVVTGLATTWATFLPCFLFILLGAPFVERLRGNRVIDAALSFVTASVVGVILNLAVVFATAVLHHGGSFDAFAALLAIAAWLALSRHWNVVLVIVAGGVLGLLRWLLVTS